MRVLRRQKSTYAISLILAVLGILALFVSVWKTWPQFSSAKDPLSTFMTLLWTEEMNLLPGFELQLIYVFALGAVMIVAGVILYALSVQSFYVPGRVVLFRCPFCHNEWRSSGDKALVHCPHCRQLVHPTLVEKGR